MTATDLLVIAAIATALSAWFDIADTAIDLVGSAIRRAGSAGRKART